MEHEPVVYVVDDDASVRRGLTNLLRSAGWRAEAFTSADEYKRASLPAVPCCLVLDVRLPGLSGIDLQRELATREVSPAIVFATGHGDIAIAVEKIQRGAVEFLTKPFREQDLLDAITRAVDRHRGELGAHVERSELRGELAHE